MIRRSNWSLVLFVQLAIVTAVQAEIHYTVSTAPQDGPTVAVLGFGPCSDDAVRFALQQIARIPVTHGRMFVAAEQVNSAARDAFDVTEEWSGTSPTSREFLETHRPEFVLVLAEDYDFQSALPAALGATISLWTGDAQLVHIAKRIKEDLNSEVAEDSEKWVMLNMRADMHPRMDYWPEWITGHSSPMIVTTSTKNELRQQRVSLRTRQLRLAAVRWLRELGMLAESTEAYPLVGESSARRPNVAIYDGPGAVSSSGHGPLWILRSISHLPLDACLIGPEDISDGSLSQFDVVVFGGGSSTKQGDGLGKQSLQAVSDFVKAGGGYVGICAGSFLARTGKSNRLGLVDVPLRCSSGTGYLDMSIAEAGNESLGVDGIHRTRLSGGPIFETKDLPSNVQVWATYDEDLPHEGKDTLKTKGAGAVISAQVKDGRVVLFGPHCERYPGPQQVFWNALTWAAGTERGLLDSYADIHVTPATVTSPHEHGEDIGEGPVYPDHTAMHSHGHYHAHSHHHAGGYAQMIIQTDHQSKRQQDSAALAVQSAGHLAPGPERIAAIRKRLLEPGLPGGLIVAHRGYHNLEPENSITAIREAAAIGAHMVEIDVRKTADGIYALMHDKTIKRTTTGSGDFAKLALADLKKYQLEHGLRPTQQRIPTMKEVMEAARGLIMLNIDLKAGDLQEVIELVRGADLLDHCVFKAEWHKLALEQRQWIKEQEGLIFMPMVDSEKELLEAMDTIGARVFELHLDDGPWGPTDKEMLKRLHDRGARLWVNSLGNGPDKAGFGDRQAVGDPSSVFCRLNDLGFDIIQTDLPDLAVEVLSDCMDNDAFLDVRLNND